MTRKKICTRKKTGNSFPQKPAQALLALLLSIGGCMILPHTALSQDSTDNTTQNFSYPVSSSLSPALIQSWKDYIKTYPAAIAQYQKNDAAARQAAKVVVASEVKNMDDLLKTYPFLQQDFQKVKDLQQKEMNYLNNNPDEASSQSMDLTPHIQIAESKDSQTGINVLFVGKSGKLWCGAHGCKMDIYVDTGAGYQKANEFIVSSDIYLSRVNGLVFLFLAPPQDPKTQDFILSNHTFVKNVPPPPEPQSQLYVGWRHEHPNQ